MKRFIFFLTLLVSTFSNLFAQGANNQADFQETQSNNLTKNEMWFNLKTWISLSFDKYDRVVDMEDADKGTLIFKWSIPSTKLYMDFKHRGTIQVDIKDNKYRIKCTNNFVELHQKEPSYTRAWEKADFDSYREMIYFVKHYDGIIDMNVYTNKIDSIHSAKVNILNNTPKFNSPKDAKKYKVSYDYSMASYMEAYTKAILEHSKYKQAIIDAMKEALIIKDDF